MGLKTNFVFILLLVTPALGLASGTYGLFMVVKGDVKVITGQKQSSQVKVGSKILPGETVSTGADSRAKIVMSDRNVINVSPNTRLVIEKYENSSSSGRKEVLIDLQEGKVRTNVEQRYDGVKNKFQIRTPTAVAGVRGTQFLVSFDPSNQITRVVTFRGAVSFAPQGASVDASAVIVKKGETTSVSPNAPAPEPPQILPKEEIQQIDRDTSVSSAPRQTPPGEGVVSEQAGGGNSSKNLGGVSEREPVQDAGSRDSGAPRSPAAVVESTPGAEPSRKSPPMGATMVDRNDLDSGLIKQIPGRPAGPAPSLSLPPPSMSQPGPPRINPTIVDVIQKQPQRTKVKIVIDND